MLARPPMRQHDYHREYTTMRYDMGWDEAVSEGRYTNRWGPDNCMRAWVDDEGCVRMQYCPALDDGNPAEDTPDYDDDAMPEEDGLAWYPTYGAQACMEGTALAFVRSDSGKRALEVYARRAGWLNEDDAGELRAEVTRLRDKLGETADGGGMPFLEAVTFAGMVEGAGGGWNVDRIARNYYNNNRFTVYAYNPNTSASIAFEHPLNSAALAARLGLAADVEH